MLKFFLFINLYERPWRAIEGPSEWISRWIDQRCIDDYDDGDDDN